MECVLCRNGITEKGLVTVTLEKDDSIILVKKVPAHICTNCGHYYLDEKISNDILNKANDAFEKGAELEVLRLQTAS